MKRTLWIAGRCSLAFCCLLLLQACATTPRSGTTIEAARESLQAQYPDLLKSFDLHLGTFEIDEEIWDTLSADSRAMFVEQCSETRREIAKRSAVRAEAGGKVLVAYDGSTTVFYGGPRTIGPEQDLRTVSQADSVPEGSVLLLSIPRPVYPARALHAKVEGTVVIQACVVRDGSVQAMLVVDGGIDMLNSAALQAVRKARFRPFDSTDGYDSVWVRIPMRFSILPEEHGYDRASHAGAGTSFSAVGTAEFDPAVTGGTDK